MRKIYLNSLSIAIFCLAFTGITYAQVGIGNTTPDNSSMLDITASDKGILIPRVSLVNVTNGTTPVNSPATSLLVYNTNATVTGGSGIGYYFWDGTEWVKFATKPSTDWTTLGNAGTTPGTNFVGTTDNQGLAFRTNNTERVRVDTNGRVGINETNPSDATLEVGGNLIVGDTFTGGGAVAEPGGMTVEGRTIFGEDDFFYTIDKLVVYGNTTWVPASVTNGDNGNGLTYGINSYTSGGTGLYAEDVDGGRGLEVFMDDNASAGSVIGVFAIDNSGLGTAIVGDNRNGTATAIGVHGRETTANGWALLASGDLNVTGNTFNISDRKLKQNIQPITGAIDIVKQLNPTSYEMKWDAEKYKNAGFSKTPQLGFIAQEVEEVLPNLIKAGKIPLNNADYIKKEIAKNPSLAKAEKKYEDVKSVNYIQLIPLLTQAIKEQQEQIEVLKQKISVLENK